MPQTLKRLLFLILMLAMLVLISSAQERATSSTESGYLFDHPADWNIRTEAAFEAVVYFDDGAMYGLISILESRFVGDDPKEALEDFIDDIPRDDRNNGDFEEPYEEYTVDEWQLVRASRVRRNDRLLEYFIMAYGNDTSVFLRASFRRGGETTYLPEFDAMIASVRSEEDEPEVAPEIQSTEIACATTGSNLALDTLTANYVFEDGSYEFDYPESWEISSNADGSLRFINREGATLFGTIQVQPQAENSPETALSAVLAEEEGYSAIEIFDLNGLAVARSYRDNTRGGTKDLAMAALRGDVIVIMTASSNSQDFDAYEASLQAVFYTFRPNGTQVELSLTGLGARQGLTSAFIYGSAVCGEPAEVAVTAPAPQSAISLGASYESENGNYRFNYPEGWTQDFAQNTVILSNRENYELFEPAGGEVQMMIFFIDRIQSLNIDEFSPTSLLEYLIINDLDFEYWTRPEEFDSLGRRGAYADFEPTVSAWLMRTYFVELDAEELIYVRLDMMAIKDEVEGFNDYALAILETVEINN